MSSVDTKKSTQEKNRIWRCSKCKKRVDYYRWGNDTACVPCAIKDGIPQANVWEVSDDDQSDEKVLPKKIPDPPNPNWDLTPTSH